MRFKQGNESIIYCLLRKKGLADSSLTNVIQGNRNGNNLRTLKFHADKLTISQLLIISGLLEGSYSFPLLCALAAGYRWDNAPKSWYDVELPPIPPQLEEMEQVVMSKKEFRQLQAERK